MLERSFSDLFNDRCTELGLLNDPDVARRINDVQPATSDTDLVRTVRNWQAGRNVPRPDYYRIILQAFDIGKDPVQLTKWHQAYNEARLKRAKKPVPEEATVPFERTQVKSLPARKLGAFANRSTTSARRLWSFIITRWPIFAATAMLVVASGIYVGIALTTGDIGSRCDAAAGARWDDQRNPSVKTRDFADIRASAIDICEEAVRQHADEARYWFQLGRAFDRDAKWHGNHANAARSFQSAIALGYSAAALSLGMLYEDGLTGPQLKPDLFKASQLYELAAAEGLPLALYCHSIATLFGWSGKLPDPVGATAYAEASVAAGSMRARSLLADLKGKSPVTRHVECSQERGIVRPSRIIAW